MRKIEDIIWRGLSLEVSGIFEDEHKGNRDTPGLPASIEISKVRYGGIDIHPVLLAAGVDMEEIEQLTIKQIINN